MDSISHLADRVDCKIFIRLINALNVGKTVSRKMTMFNGTTINPRFVETAFRRANTFVFDENVNYQLGSILFWKLDMIDSTNDISMIGEKFFPEHIRKNKSSIPKTKKIMPHIHSERDKEDVYLCIAKLLRMLKYLCGNSQIVYTIERLISNYELDIRKDFALNSCIFMVEIGTTELDSKEIKKLSADEKVLKEIDRRKEIRNKDGFKIRLFLYVFFMNFLKKISKLGKNSSIEAYSKIAQDLFSKIIFSQPFSQFFYEYLPNKNYRIKNGFSFVSGDLEKGFALNDVNEEQGLDSNMFIMELEKVSAFLTSIRRNKNDFQLDQEGYYFLRHYLPKCFDTEKLDDETLQMIVDYYLDFLFYSGFLEFKVRNFSHNQIKYFESDFIKFLSNKLELEKFKGSLKKQQLEKT